MQIKSHEEIDISDLLEKLSGLSPWQEGLFLSWKMDSGRDETVFKYAHERGQFSFTYAYVTIDKEKNYINIQFEH